MTVPDVWRREQIGNIVCLLVFFCHSREFFFQMSMNGAIMRFINLGWDTNNALEDFEAEFLLIKYEYIYIPP